MNKNAIITILLALVFRTIILPNENESDIQ